MVAYPDVPTNWLPLSAEPLSLHCVCHFLKTPTTHCPKLSYVFTCFISSLDGLLAPKGQEQCLNHLCSHLSHGFLHMVFIYLFNKFTQYILGRVLYQVDRPLQTLTSPPAEAKLIPGIPPRDERASQTIPTQEGLNEAWRVPSSKLHSKFG